MNKIYPYAGFWKRALAFLIDGIILSIPMALFSFLAVGTQVFSIIKLAGNHAEPSPEIFVSMLGKWILGIMAVQLFSIVLWWLYHAIMESGKHQATFGKMALGIKVVGAHGERISFARATGRTFGKFVSHMILYFGDYMAGFTQHRQALHDLMASTYVVDKTYQEGQELPALRFSTGGLIASILAAIAPIVLYVGAILIAMMSAMSDFKNNLDIQQIQVTKTTGGNQAQFRVLDVESEDGTEVPFQIKDINDEDETKRIAAQTELLRLRYREADTSFPFTKENIEYDKTSQGYTATWNDSQQNQYILLQKKDGSFSCWLKVPESFDLRFSITKPCE